MDWSGLPSELLDAILGKITECTDHLRFCCVCRSWRSAGKSHPVPPSLPWLHLPHDLTSTILKFYSLSEDRVYKIPFPEVYNSHVSGSASGFLLVVGYNWTPKVMMINPFTGTRARLPDTYGLYPDTVWDYSGSIVVARMGTRTFDGVAYCRPGGDSWTRIKSLSDRRNINEIVYKAGYFHLLEYRAAEICVLDGETLQLTRIIRPPNFISKYSEFIVSPHDILLCTNSNFNKYTKWITVLFSPNSLLEEPRWSKVTDIGNYAVFPGCRNMSILSEASKHSGLRNTVIRHKLRVRNMETATCYINAHNLRDSKVELKGKCSCSKNPSWILPRFDTAYQ